jgi:protein involved in polysaccharide export with SLBB domain
MRAGIVLVSLACAMLVSPGGAFAQAADPASAAAAFDVSAYRLGRNDRVKVTVYNEPTLSGEFSVNADGSLAFPLIGDVPAEGKSPIELKEALEKALSNGFVRQPSISVEVLTFRPFYIYGEVNNPGQYAYSPGLTVLNAVALARGFTYRANQKRIFLKRAAASTSTEVKVNSDTTVLPGDTVRVAERYF